MSAEAEGGRKSGLPKSLRLLVAAGAGLCFALLLWASGLAERLDFGLWDAALRIEAPVIAGRAGARPSGGRIELIYVDQYSLSWVERNLGHSWPWPRELYGLMAGFLSQAKAQAYDILFTEASPYGPDDDRKCAEAMDRAGNVVLAEALDASGARFSPLPVSNTAYGAVKGIVDRDGTLRRYEPLGRGGTPSLGLALLERGGEAPEAGSLAGVFHLRFRGQSPTFRARNAAEILSAALGGGGPSPSDYRGVYVVVGFSAPGLLDRQAVPTDPAMPGAEIHATFAADCLDGALLRPLPPLLGWLAASACAAAAGAAAAFLSGPLALALAAFLAAAAPAALGIGLHVLGLAAPMGPSLAASVFAYALGIVLSYAAEGRRRAFLRRSFAQYLSPAVIDQLVKDPGLLSLGGQERTLSFFFSDLRGFSSISEPMEPGRLAEFMNLYLSIVTKAVLDEDGTLDKYVGDAVVAFWNAPLGQADHAARAVRAALACQRSLEAARGRFAALGVEPPFTRIGIHTGKAVVGNMGSPSRFNYTALGDAVNTASRLEAANKVIGGAVLASGATVEACAGGLDPAAASVSAGGLEFRRLGRILVDGRKGAVEVWEPRAAGGSYSEVGPWEGERSCRLKTISAEGAGLPPSPGAEALET